MTNFHLITKDPPLWYYICDHNHVGTHVALISEVHRERERLDQATTTNQISGGELLPFHGGERHGCVGGRGEATGGDSGSGSPSNLPPAANF